MDITKTKQLKILADFLKLKLKNIDSGFERNVIN